MHKNIKPILALVLSLVLSVSTLSNMYTVRADDEITQEEPVVEETQTEEETTEEQVPTVEEQTPTEEEQVPAEEEEPVVEEEQLGDSNMMEYFLVDNPVLSNGETENFILSLNNAEGYSDFRLTIQKEDGTSFDLECSEQVDNLVKFSRVFNEEEKGQYSVTTLHYVYNGQAYYLNFSDLEMDVKFGVDQEYDGYDATLPDLTEDSISSEGIIEVTDVNKAEEEIVNGVASQPATMSVDEFSRHATGGMTICLDPGHGGSDSGATAFGAKESDLTLKIARYCKEELAKYDVNVVMTRTTDTRLSEEAAMDLKNRVEVAKKAGASYFISIHINSAQNSAAHGAEVYYPNTSGNKNLSTNGQNLAKAIQKQLTALGLYDRGIKIRNYTDGTTSSNPNSSDQDYYGVIRYAKQANITGLIVEHCFISNKEEFDKYLGSDAKLQQLGIADAKGIVSALGLQAKNAHIDALAAENRNVLADGTYTISTLLNSNYVLDVKDGHTNNGANIQLYENNDTAAQQFNVSHDSQGYVTFTNVKSGKVLDLSDAVVKNGGNIQQYKSNGTRAQKWIVKRDGDGYIIISALNSNYVLDLHNAVVNNYRNIQLYSYNGTNAQRWNITKYVSKEQRINNLAAQNKNTLADGVYEICSVKNSNYALDVNSASTRNGANVQLYLRNGTQAQAFKVSHDSQGFVTFTNINSGKVIDLDGAITKNGRNIHQYASNGTRAQKWIVQKSGSGYSIVSAIDTSFALDIRNGFVYSGSNIQLYKSNNTAAQQWTFNKYVTERERCDSYASQNKGRMPDGVYYIKNQNVGYALDVADGSLYAGANVQLYSLNRTNAQKWKITHDSTGYVSFQNVGSGMYLTASGSGRTANVYQQRQTNDYNQKWIVMFDNNQNLRIVSALNSTMVLDVKDGKIRRCSNIQLYTSNNSNAQKWVFEYINTNATGVLMQIMGTSQTTVAQMVRYYNANASGYDTFKAKYNGKYDGCLAKGGASTINQFAQIFYEEATAEGVRAEVAFTQCMKETGFLKYGGDVLPNQYNFAGIGATGAVHGASFSNVRMGVRAQIQHLKAYGSISPLTNPCVDPRFNLVKRGSAQYVEWLGIKENPNGYGWATSKNYGHDIVSMVNVLLKK
ncbi:RICIN domain-containing protein [Holdemanella porci]|uniref:RICIN domain-containing protein n=1 Tax=Holdemanella porci TaxID=2652276 RepID=UPI001C27CB6D|nr:RICIN domain-containing protein [Holdemanella porci]MBU9131071.1 RICIN domain-containing protein [Holdemanella porci]MBU9873014.1 RICIN domain-containing protein [Holdemanella porci]MBU9887954.1 RICIN domain-containing protein [Holdemanella porci]